MDQLSLSHSLERERDPHCGGVCHQAKPVTTALNIKIYSSVSFSLSLCIFAKEL